MHADWEQAQNSQVKRHGRNTERRMGQHYIFMSRFQFVSDVIKVIVTISKPLERRWLKIQILNISNNIDYIEYFFCSYESSCPFSLTSAHQISPSS